MADMKLNKKGLSITDKIDDLYENSKKYDLEAGGFDPNRKLGMKSDT